MWANQLRVKSIGGRLVNILEIFAVNFFAFNYFAVEIFTKIENKVISMSKSLKLHHGRNKNPYLINRYEFPNRKFWGYIKSKLMLDKKEQIINSIICQKSYYEILSVHIHIEKFYKAPTKLQQSRFSTSVKQDCYKFKKWNLKVPIDILYVSPAAPLQHCFFCQKSKYLGSCGITLNLV